MRADTLSWYSGTVEVELHIKVTIGRDGQLGGQCNSSMRADKD